VNLYYTLCTNLGVVSPPP